MNCRDYQHQITLLLYEELSEKARPGLEAHLRQCAACQGVYEAETNVHSVLSEDTAGWEIPSDLLVESRRSLADALDRLEQKRSRWSLPALSVIFTPMRLLESGALVAMGLALGVYVSNQQAQAPISTVQETQTSGIPSNASISNLRIVNADPATGQVELAGEVSQPLRLQGQMEDATVRSLLLSALYDTSNPGSRLRAVQVLARKTNEESIEEALIVALTNDKVAAVRMQALEVLKQYANEEHVRAAFMQTLANDTDSGIRREAIEALTKSNSNDKELAKTIRAVTEKDDSDYLRTKALEFVGAAK